jgi:hypothetical protein
LELEKRIDSNSKIKLSPTYYSLSVNSKKLKNLNIFGHPKADLYKRIIREIILYEISGRGLRRIPTETDLKTVLSNLGIKRSELIRIHPGLKFRFYYPLYPRRKGNIVMTSFGFDTFEQIYSLKSNNDIRIFSVVQRLRSARDKRPIKIFKHFSYVIRGVTVEELMQHINFTEKNIR